MGAKRGGKRPGAGRPQGARSRATREQKATLEALARSHTETALNTLVNIAKKSDSDAARVSAANAILDRGYGKPSQSHQHSGPSGGAIPIIDASKLSGMSDEELEVLERALVKIGASAGDQGGAAEPGGEPED